MREPLVLINGEPFLVRDVIERGNQLEQRVLELEHQLAMINAARSEIGQYK